MRGQSILLFTVSLTTHTQVYAVALLDIIILSLSIYSVFSELLLRQPVKCNSQQSSRVHTLRRFASVADLLLLYYSMYSWTAAALVNVTAMATRRHKQMPVYRSRSWLLNPMQSCSGKRLPGPCRSPRCLPPLAESTALIVWLCDTCGFIYYILLVGI